MIEAENISLHYGGSQILYGVSLSAGPGEVACVMGNNGAGKTSLMNVLAGRHPRSGGELRLMGERLGRVTAQEMARRGVAYVPQGRAIFPMLTVRENLELGGWLVPKGPGSRASPFQRRKTSGTARPGTTGRHSGPPWARMAGRGSGSPRIGQ